MSGWHIRDKLRTMSVQCCLTSTETIRLIRTGSPGKPLDFHTAPELWKWHPLVDEFIHHQITSFSIPAPPFPHWHCQLFQVNLGHSITMKTQGEKMSDWLHACRHAHTHTRTHAHTHTHTPSLSLSLSLTVYVCTHCQRFEPLYYKIRNTLLPRNK